MGISSKMTYALAIHGGAGAKLSTDYSKQIEHLEHLVSEGQKMLIGGCLALSVVTDIILELEKSGLYVAGKGSAPNIDGQFELDASIMDGRTQSAGAVASLQGIVHPILAARKILEDDRHVLLTGDGALKMSQSLGLEEVSSPNTYYSEHLKHGSADGSKHGTVGVVALDTKSGLAAGTSTGGTFGKLAGRTGDTGIIGAGTWADDSVAVSCTGIGESFIRVAAAHDVSARMRYGQRTLNEATAEVLNEIKRCDGDGGIIALDIKGNISMPFNTDGMKCAAVSSIMPKTVSVFDRYD